MPKSTRKSDANLCTFRYPIHADVYVESIGLPGKVLSRCDHGHDVHTYRVVYWANGTRHDQWLQEFELGEK